MHTTAEADFFESCLGKLIPFGTRNTAIHKRELNIFKRVERRNKVEALENKAYLLIADIAHLIIRKIINKLAVYVILTFRGSIKQAKHIHER